MKTVDQIETCMPQKRIVDAHVRIEPSHYHIVQYARTPEERTKRLEEWAKELKEFFRDHRHQDVNSVDVVRDVRDFCSACNEELEPVRYGTDPEEDCEQYTGCANCGRRIIREKPQ